MYKVTSSYTHDVITKWKEKNEKKWLWVGTVVAVDVIK